MITTAVVLISSKDAWLRSVAAVYWRSAAFRRNLLSVAAETASFRLISLISGLVKTFRAVDPKR